MLPRFEAGPALALMQKEDVTFFAGVPTMYWGLLGALDDSASTSRSSPAQPAGRGGRRLGPAGRGAQGVRESASASRSSRATASPRPRRWPPSRRDGEPAARRLDRRPDPRRRDEADRPRAAGTRTVEDGDGRRRRDRDQGPQHHEGLLRPARRHRRGDPGRLVPLRRPRPQGRGRLVLHRRPVQGHDHPRRLQRVPARDRGGPDDPPGRLAGRRHRRTPREPRRGDQGGRHPQRRRRRSPRTSWSRGARSRWPATSTPASSSSSTRCR